MVMQTARTERRTDRFEPKKKIIELIMLWLQHSSGPKRFDGR